MKWSGGTLVGMGGPTPCLVLCMHDQDKPCHPWLGCCPCIPIFTQPSSTVLRHTRSALQCHRHGHPLGPSEQCLEFGWLESRWRNALRPSRVTHVGPPLSNSDVFTQPFSTDLRSTHSTLQGHTPEHQLGPSEQSSNTPQRTCQNHAHVVALSPPMLWLGSSSQLFNSNPYSHIPHFDTTDLLWIILCPGPSEQYL